MESRSGRSGTYEKEDRSNAKEARANDGHDPMHTGPRRQSEPKETDRNEKGANDCDRHTLLRFELPLVIVLGFLHVVQVGEEGRHDDQRSNENAEERQAEELLPPMVDTNEKDREGLKSDVEKGID